MSYTPQHSGTGQTPATGLTSLSAQGQSTCHLQRQPMETGCVVLESTMLIPPLPSLSPTPQQNPAQMWVSGGS